MHRRVINTPLVCLLALIVLATNSAPMTTRACSDVSSTQQKKCCGCCQTQASTSKGAKSCCQARAAAQAVAAAKAKCRCSQGSPRPITPAPLPTGDEELLKQTLAANLEVRTGQSLPFVISRTPRNESSDLTLSGSALCIRFCTWQT